MRPRVCCGSVRSLAPCADSCTGWHWPAVPVPSLDFSPLFCWCHVEWTDWPQAWHHSQHELVMSNTVALQSFLFVTMVTGRLMLWFVWWEWAKVESWKKQSRHVQKCSSCSLCFDLVISPGCATFLNVPTRWRHRARDPYSSTSSGKLICFTWDDTDTILF